MSNPFNGAANGLKKTVSALTSVATLLTLSGAAFLAPVGTMAAVPSDYGLTEGNTISAANTNDPDVYIVNAFGYKRLFLNPVIFNFYGHLGGFAKVKVVSAAARDAFPTSGLFRNCETSDQKVWAVESTGEDTGTLHWVNMSGDAAVAQDANFFKKVFCINNNEANWYTKSSVAYTSLSQVPVYSRVPGSTPTPIVNGSVSASLSPDNPAAGTVVAAQGVADLAHFRLTNTNSSPVAVNSLSFQRLGISGDSTLSNAYVYMMTPGTSIYGTRLTDSVTPSTGVMNYNGGTSTNTIVTIPANGYVDIAFRSDILTGTSGQTIGVALTSVNGAAVSGLSGNLMTVAATPSDLATAVWATSASLVPATAGVTSDPLKDTVVWQNTLTVSNKNILVRRMALRQTNSINNADVSNFRLFVDGVQIAQTQNLDSNGYVTFVPVTPYTVLTGARTVKVLADITGGTSRKLTMSLRSSADVGLVDSNYNVSISSTIASSGTFPLTAGDITINSGSIVVQKDSTSPSGNVVKGASDVVLGRWTFTAYGEPVKVSTLIAGLKASNASTANLRNGRVMAYPVGNPAAAQQYGSTSNMLTSTTASTSYTVNLTVNPGTPMIVETRADIYDNDGTDDTTAADTFQSKLYIGGSNGQGMVSLTTSNVPSATNAANSMTVQSGTMSITKYASFPDKQIQLPQSAAKIGDFVVTGSTNEAINVNTLTLDVTVGGGASINDLSNVYLKYNGVPTSVKSTISATGNTYSLSSTALPVNGSVHVEVFTDLANRSGSPTYQSKLLVSGTTVQSAIAVSTNTGSTFSGQTMTGGTGTIASSAINNPAAQLVAANSTADVAKFTFTATNDTFNITEIQLKTVASASQGGIANVILKKSDGTVVGSLPITLSGASNIVTFGSLTGLNVPSNDPSGITLTAAVQTSNVGVGAASSNYNVGISLNYFKNTNSSGTLATDNTDRVGASAYLHNAYPQVAAVALPTTLLTTGVQSVSKFSVAAVGSSNSVIGLGRILWTVNKTTTPNIASGSWQLFEDGVDISSFGTFASSSVGVGRTAGYVQWTASSTNVERTVPTAGHTYELKVNITAAGTSGDSYQTSLNAATSAVNADRLSIIAPTAGSGPALTWTDRTSSSHAQTTADWFNDYLVKVLPVSQGLSK